MGKDLSTVGRHGLGGVYDHEFLPTSMKAQGDREAWGEHSGTPLMQILQYHNIIGKVTCFMYIMSHNKTTKHCAF